MSHIPTSSPLSLRISWATPAVLLAAVIGGVPPGPQERAETRPSAQSRPAATRPAPAARDSRPATRTSDSGPYRSNEYGFSIQFPQGWEIKEKAEGCAAIAISPKENPRDEFREHVAVSVEEVPDGTALKEYVDRTVEKYKTNLHEFALSDQQDTSLGTAKGSKVVYAYTLGLFHLRNVEYIVLVPGRAVIVRGSCEAGKFDANKTTIETVAKSLAVQ